MGRVGLVLLALFSILPSSQYGQTAVTSRFALPPAPLMLHRSVTTGAFFDVVGRRSAAFGYEGRSVEAWVYPIKVFDEFQLSFSLDGYPVPMAASELPGTIEVRPESTILTVSHAAFTVRQIIFAPIDEPGIVILLEIDTRLPMTVIGSFRASLRLMWPATAATANVDWNAVAHAYELGQENGRFAAVVGVPDGNDRSLMPYQEEPRDVPLQFTIQVSPERARREYIPIVVTAAMEGRAAARAAYRQLLSSVETLYRQTAEHYRRLLDRSVSIDTPNDQLDRAYDWARVGMDKGLATNSMLGTGLLAGFRTSGNSERPGFAWFFGRDALWTSLALTASGSIGDARTALEFLARHQRADGKIPHEISQSAGLIAWFTDFPYAWASADATPLYVIAQADLWRSGGDRVFLERYWPSIHKAYAFSAGTDADGNGLIDNTSVGHGWVEGGALYPPHEEIYLQGLWIEASRSLAEMATAVRNQQVADSARAAAERTQAAVESTYWLSDRSHYAFATRKPRTERAIAEPGPERERRQRRMDELAAMRLVDEDTVLPAVPMWWRTLDPERADAQIDRLGSAAIATDWGHRILNHQSLLYDPLSYHYGSVWPLFTGWASMAAYRYGRPQVGYHALLANALLTEPGALGYVTELLSGDFNAAFGRSSHHQIWSEAMVAAPFIRGLLGIEPLEGGTRLRIAPQLPADWNRVAVRGIVSAGTRFDIDINRAAGLLTMGVTAQAVTAAAPALVIAPTLPLDAQLERATVDGKPTRANLVRAGDVQFATIEIPKGTRRAVAQFHYRDGSDVYMHTRAPRPGALSEGIRILRSRADARALRVLLEGRNGRTYDLFLRTSRRPTAVRGATLVPEGGRDPIVRVAFEGPVTEYTRREVVIELRR